MKEHIKGVSYWKFYNSLLNDKDFISQMKLKIPEFYKEATELSNPNARWNHVKYQIPPCIMCVQYIGGVQYVGEIS